MAQRDVTSRVFARPLFGDACQLFGFLLLLYPAPRAGAFAVEGLKDIMGLVKGFTVIRFMNDP